MKKIFGIIIITIVILLGYKIYLLYRYHVDKIDLYTENIFKDTLTIKTKETSEQLYNYEKISFRDDFSNLTKNGEFYVKYDSNNEVVGAFSISKMPQYYLLLHDGSLLISDQIKDQLFDEEDRQKLCKEKNINNDIDLYNYIKDNYYLKTSIFD